MYLVKRRNRTFSVLFYINADIAPLGLYRQHLCNSRFTTTFNPLRFNFNCTNKFKFGITSQASRL